MKILFMGTSRFAVPTLEALVNAGHEIAAVITQPDRPSGRGRNVHVSPIKETAEQFGIPIFQPEKIRAPEAVEKVRSYAPLDAIVVAAFGQIVPQPILEIPKYGSINVHGSLLPKYRGAAPIQHAVMAGETTTGVTTMLMDPGLDTGDILLQRKLEIEPNETAGELQERLSQIGAELLIETLDRLERGEITPEPQDNSQATLAPSLKREQGRIDWKRPAVDIVNLVRAFTPRPGAYTELNNTEIKIIKTEVGPDDSAGMNPGQVVDIGRDEIIVAAGEGTVRLVEVQPQNKKRMGAGEFARGIRLIVADKFANA